VPKGAAPRKHTTEIPAKSGDFCLWINALNNSGFFCCRIFDIGNILPYLHSKVYLPDTNDRQKKAPAKGDKTGAQDALLG
jgi:hypothetical protein